MWRLRDAQSPTDAALRLLVNRVPLDEEGFERNIAMEIYGGSNEAQISADRILRLESGETFTIPRPGGDEALGMLENLQGAQLQQLKDVGDRNF